MVVVKKKSKKESNKDDGRPKGDRNQAKSKSNYKQIKYVYLASSKAIFLVTGDPKESKYSYGVPIIPLHGYYKADGKPYQANELRDYYVVLNVEKGDEMLEHLAKGKVVIIGYSEDDVIIVEGGEE